jgi:hypothetical protein
MPSNERFLLLSSDSRNLRLSKPRLDTEIHDVTGLFSAMILTLFDVAGRHLTK